MIVVPELKLNAVEPQTAAGVAAAEIENIQEEPIMDLKELQEKHADLYKSVIEEGRKTGIEEGKKAARTPQVFGGGRRTVSKETPAPLANMRDAEAAALADPEILSIFSESAT